jgi:CspA family cold shock protein
MREPKALARTWLRVRRRGIKIASPAHARASFSTFGVKLKMATGTVKWFKDDKGFGFVTPDGGGKDLFAHFSEIRAEGFKTLKEGQKVTFDEKMGLKGKQAANIKPA